MNFKYIKKIHLNSLKYNKSILEKIKRKNLKNSKKFI